MLYFLSSQDLALPLELRFCFLFAEAGVRVEADSGGRCLWAHFTQSALGCFLVLS